MLKLFLFTLFYSLGSLANTCRLDKPIHIGSNDLLKTRVLSNVRFDRVPRFHKPENYDPKKDTLHVNLFNIHWNDKATGYVGAMVGVDNKLESMGLSPYYSGNLSISGSTQTSGDLTTNTTQTADKYTEPQHAKNDAIHELKVMVEKGEIVSIEFKMPIFRVWKTEAGAIYLAFTGDHQTLCLLDGELVP